SDEQICLSSSKPGAGELFLSRARHHVYNPSLSLARIGVSVIITLIISLFGLVFLHARKRINPVSLWTHRTQHIVVLTDKVLLCHPHCCDVRGIVNNGVELCPSKAEVGGSEACLPPNYSGYCLDQRPSKYDLVPGPYHQDTATLHQADDNPPYEKRRGSWNSQTSKSSSSFGSDEKTEHSGPGILGPGRATAQPRSSRPAWAVEQI
uniref:Uncharacterized protein n=1 Tax=Macaca fascicularis TaxID=9541 RepID=A0A7N9CWH2_MACFA